MDVSSIFFFFFSSRRRHTRCLSDWSSDVCSSDLAIFQRRGIRLVEHCGAERIDRGAVQLEDGKWHQADAVFVVTEASAAPWLADRSEERRVGKEWRCRRSRWQEIQIGKSTRGCVA